MFTTRKILPLLSGFLLLLFVVSCHKTTSVEMDYFVTGTIQNFVKSDDHYGVTLKTENDSVIYGVLYPKNFKAYSDKVKQIQAAKKISIKGILNCAEQKNDKESCIIDIRAIKVVH